MMRFCPLSISKRAVLRMLIFGVRRIDHEPSVETLARPAFLCRSGGTPNRTRRLRLDAPLLVGVEREMSKNLTGLAAQFCFITRDRHVAHRALVFNGGFRFGMIDGFATNARLPVGIARRVGHDAGAPLKTDGDVLAR